MNEPGWVGPRRRSILGPVHIGHLAAALLAALGSLLLVTGPIGRGERSTADDPSAIATTVVDRAPDAAPAAAVSLPASPPFPKDQQVFAYYYLWWSERHWIDLLGPDYPLAQVPQPLPASLDAGGCAARREFDGANLTDVQQPPRGQDTPGVIEADVRNAIDAGLTGFAVNWVGTGSEAQRIEDSRYTMRLQELVRVVDEVNAEGRPFSLWLNYKGSAVIRTLDEMRGDLAFFDATFADDPVFEKRGGRTVVVLAGSRKYSTAHLRAVSRAHRDRFFLVGDETGSTWNDARAEALDGNHYYWSSQNPYTNPASFEQLRTLAARVHAGPQNPDGTSKMWVAPVTPGFNATLIGGASCVSRNDGATMRLLAEGNLGSRPDAWLLISWNEIAEGTYVQPMTRYGTRYLDVFRSIFR